MDDGGLVFLPDDDDEDDGGVDDDADDRNGELLVLVPADALISQWFHIITAKSINPPASQRPSAETAAANSFA